MKYILAIVIPAYKPDYLSEALKSVADQTCRDFRVYIGDDAGPVEIGEIVNKFREDLEIIYHRFPENLGNTDLAAHWDRCVALTSDEEFIWLFSDDDLMPERAAGELIKAIKLNNVCDLFRFNLRQIDEHRSFISEATNHPEFETSENFIVRRLKGLTLSAACEYIFRKETYLKKGGFVKFPLAWCSDDATWYSIARENGIVTVQPDPVLWRISGKNLSFPGKETEKKFVSTMLFYRWLRSQSTSYSFYGLLPASLMRQMLILNISIKTFLKYSLSIIRLIGIYKTLRLGFVITKSRIGRLA